MNTRKNIAWTRAFAVVVLLSMGLLMGCKSDDGKSVRPFLSEPYPEKLSAWRLFVGTPASMTPNQGVIPYELNTPLFTDYAEKYRTIWMPKGKKADYREGDVLAFPVGTIISKTFYYRREDMKDARAKIPVAQAAFAKLPAADRPLHKHPFLLETRLLVHTSDGWVALPYVWNEKQTEAVLEIAGEKKVMHLNRGGKKVGFDYFVPNQNQCSGCHVRQARQGKEIKFKKTLRPIGPKPSNLNREYPYVAGKINQLAKLTQAGYLQGAPAADKTPRMAVWNKPKTGSLDARARAYLDANCAHCHSAIGPASTSGLHLDMENKIAAKLGVCKTPIAAGRGSGGRLHDIVPGKPDKSILFYRMASKEADVMMPELGKTLVHDEGVALMRAWISAMKGGCDS